MYAAAWAKMQIIS